MVNLIWAESLNGIIGNNGRMPWHSHEDMVHFRQLTKDHTVIMGWNTFCSLKKRPLPQRDNLVLTHRDLSIPGVKTVSLATVKQLVTSEAGDFFVIGGASVYQQLLPLATRLYRTIIKVDYPGDKKMPPIDYDQWRLISRCQVSATRVNEPNCEFQVWQHQTKNNTEK